MRPETNRKLLSVAAISLGMACLLGLFIACGSSSSEPPAALNPAPPIRKAFLVSLQVAGTQIAQYETMHGHVPEGDGMGVLLAAGMRSVPQMDPWGNEVKYHGSGSSYTLSSAGPDGQWGTPDDIVIEDGQAR